MMTDQILANWKALEGATPELGGRKHGKECEGCGGWQFASRGYELAGVRGWFCSILCLEQVLFSGGRCRWCGNQLNGRSDARFCSSACRDKNETATFGSGARLLNWLRSNQPDVWRSVVSTQEPNSVSDARRGQLSIFREERT